MADTITIRTSTERDVVKIVERGPQGPAGGGGGGGSGTVTSVALAGTGLSITGSPVTASGTITANVSYGTTAGTACQGNDSRLSDARTPTAHTHVAADITDLQTNGNAAGLWDSLNDEQLVSTGDGELQIRKTGTALSGAFNAGQITVDRGYNLPDASGTLALTTTVVNNAAGLWDSANSVTGATVSDYELSVTNGTNTSVLTFPVGASRNYTFPNAAGTLALTSDITKTAVGLGNVPNVDTTNAANISSGVLPNARVNWAAPSAIGSTTAAAGAFTTLTANNGTLTASAPVLDLSQTWNNAAVAFIGARFNVTDTASSANASLVEFQLNGASYFRVQKEKNTGLQCCVDVGTGSGASMDFQCGGNRIFRAYGAGAGNQPLYIEANGGLQFSPISPSTASSNLQAEAANTLACRQGTAAQTFNIYNTSSSNNTNYERGFMRWNASVLEIGAEAGGTGSNRNVRIGNINNVVFVGTATTLGGTGLVVNAGANQGSLAFYQCGVTLLNSRAEIRGGANATDIVAVENGLLKFSGLTNTFPALKRSSTTLQVRLADDSAFAPLQCSTLVGSDNGTVATLGSSGEFRLTSTGQLAFASRGAILMSADGVMWLSNNAGTDFGRLAFGGTTSSFPAIKRSSAILQARLADDSGYTVLDAQLRAQGTAPATSGAAGTAGDIRYDADYIYVCTATNTWKRAAIATW